MAAPLPTKATDPSMKTFQDLMAECKTQEERRILNACYRTRYQLGLKPGEFPKVETFSSGFWNKAPGLSLKSLYHHYNVSAVK